ncbi:MAG: M48 family metalloprotease, partial [Nitrospirales bacterium]
MDFFEHQEQARRATSWLLLLFALAVAALIAGLYLVVAGLVGYARYTGNPLAAQPLDLWVRWDPTVLGWVALGTGTVIFLGTLYKISQLKAGGPAVAESVGGRPVESATTDPEERQLVNVVEEMALASGIPPPPVYLLDREPGINAFAAGYTPDDAAIGLTRGALAYLSRQELQGVIAHEFSHILNGDMRLSTRLIGLIHGILVISLAGRQMLYRSRWHSGFRRSGGGRLAVLGVGGGLLLIGALGVFFGNLIKAAVSRQREYLADAAAVQFTRFPSGLT